MQSGTTRMRQRQPALPLESTRSGHEPRPFAPGPRFAHDFTRVPAQAKLKVSTPGDSYEQEADRVADGVFGGIQRKSSGAAANESPDVDPILRGPAHPLDARTRSLMEPHFGHDFSRVRVHADPSAAASADSLGARAYTVGNHLVFGPGQYRPGSAEGQRLLAHELTHVMQQSAAGPMIQRAIQRGPASDSPKLVMAAPARDTPCACLVFMHHDEINARHAAKAMHALCNYNLAIVSPAGGREIDIRNVGKRDPNELFPRHIFRECVDDDKPCQEFLDQKKASKDKAESLEYVQRQFFLTIKECSKKFTLPIISLHTNTVDDTAHYRAKLKAKKKAITKGLSKKDLDEKTKKDLDEKKASLEKIEGKTFTDVAPEQGELPFTELEQWLLDHMPELVKEVPQKEKEAKAKKEKKPVPKTKLASKVSKSLLSPGKTNIFRWCLANDNARCHIGDPDHPDNIVWVTREEDFKKLQGTKANVALQTRVTPGESETDLSSMFVGSLDDDVLDRLKREPAPPASTELSPDASLLDRVIEWAKRVLKRVEDADAAERLVIAKREKVRFINIETPQATQSGTERLEGYRSVREILTPLGLHCCDETADEQIEEAMKTGVKPKVKEDDKAEPAEEAK